MKKFAIYISLVLIAIIMADTSTIEKIGFSSAKRRIFDDYMRMVVVSNTGDSLLSVPPDSVRLFIATQLSDSVQALDHRTLARLDSFSLAKTAELNDSISAVESRMTVDLSDSTQAAIDSARTVLTNSKAYTNAREVAITTAYKTAIRDSLNRIETMVADSSQAYVDSLRTAKTDLKYYTTKSIHDTLGQSNVIIPLNLTVHNEITVDDTLNIASSKFYQVTSKGNDFLQLYNTGGLEISGNTIDLNGEAIRKESANLIDIDARLSIDSVLSINSLTIENPSNGLMTINAPTVSIPSDSTYAGQVLHADTTKTNIIIMPNGAVFSNTDADTARVTETVFKVQGKLVNFNDYISHRLTSNTILGVKAGEGMTSGYSNTVTGEQAGKSITMGYVNSIYGAEAGRFLTTGFHNNLMGYKAGAYITTGNYNNFFGSESGYRITTGEHNTIMGHNAMLGSTGDAGTASYNTAIGANACYKVATGGNNVALGFRSMGHGDGDNNTMLGFYAGYSSNPTGVFNNNVFIGFLSGWNLPAASDSLIISSNGNDLIEGSFADSSLIATGNFTVGKNLYFPNSATISNTHADSLQFSETAFKFAGNLKTTGLLELTKGTTTTFTQNLNRLTITGDSLSIRAITNINPYRATSPQSTTVIGMNAGKSGMSGANNVIIGYQSGDNLTTGNTNTFNGANSGYSNTTGNSNTFNGYVSGRSNTTGYYNTFNGAYSGYANTTGYSNTFNGYVSGYSNTTGYNNTFNGYHSGRLNTTGNYNLCLGDSAGYSNTSGSRNVFIGYKSIGTATSSDQFIVQSDNGLKTQRLMEGSFADSSLTVNGNISYKKPFGKFHRIYTQTPANPDAWENIRWNEKHAETTSHFTATADSQGVIISKAGIYAVRCVSKMLWTGSPATTVSSYFRLWQGKGAAITKELRTSQHTSVKEKNTSNANDEFFWGSRYFAAGDTVYAQWRTSNVGNLIRGSAIFANPTSASIVIEYIKER